MLFAMTTEKSADRQIEIYQKGMDLKQLNPGVILGRTDDEWLVLANGQRIQEQQPEDFT